MGSITFKHVYKQYKGEARPAVNDFHLSVAEGEFLVLVGPSGCGKSTTLRMLAGLESISQGEIYINNKFINYTSPKNRDIAMVFQNYALYPNLSAYNNMALGLQLRKTAKHEIEQRVNRAARNLEMSHLLGRKPGQLSGGQKQRVALGRAIVREPQVFLMDEPLSNLDAKLRAQTRAELIKLHSELRTTTVYVTHDQVEAMTMGTRIVVMKDGVIQQAAAPRKLYNEPANLFVAGFIGSPPMNFIPGSVLYKEGAYSFDNRRFSLPIPPAQSAWFKQAGVNRRALVLGIRPEHLSIGSGYTGGYTGSHTSLRAELSQQAVAEEASPPITVNAVVEMSELMGADTYVYAAIGETTVIVRADASIALKPSDQVQVQFRMAHAHFFDQETGLSLRPPEEVEP